MDKSFRHYRGEVPPEFVNEWEEQVAHWLDEEGIPWLYEPVTFVLEQADDGRITEGFTPDFYLPEADLWLECTAMKQSLTNAKNRKIRKLRDRGEVVTVLYRRDLERLAAQYGRRVA